MTDHNVKYLLIGGYAVAYHGYIRTTGDLDVFVDCSNENADNLLSACKAFGMGSTLSKDLFLKPGNVLRFGVPRMRLEILNKISGVSFQECWESRETIHLEHMTIPVISLKKLIQNKQSSGRSKDGVDVEMLTSDIEDS